MEAKKSPEVKPWVRRVVEAAGVFMPANADGEQRLGWWGVEKVRSGTKESRDANSASLPALRGAAPQGLVGNRCASPSFRVYHDAGTQKGSPSLSLPTDGKRITHFYRDGLLLKVGDARQ